MRCYHFVEQFLSIVRSDKLPDFGKCNEQPPYFYIARSCIDEPICHIINVQIEY